MNEFYLIGEQLQIPQLRFNPSSLQAQHENARQGLRRYGPYDAQRLGKDRVRCTLIYPQHLTQERQTLVSGLVNGNGPFGGFQSLFRIPLEFVNERRVPSENLSEFESEISTALRNDQPDLVVVITRGRNQPIYAGAKSLLLGNGIPSQVVTAEKLRNPKGLPWTLENIALQIYAKIGGTPWTVMCSSQRKDLVIGVSRAMDTQRNYVVGFITLFMYDGDYQFLYSLAPKPIEWKKLDEYRDALAQLIIDAYSEYERQQGKPSSLVIHLCKRPGKFREIAAVEKALQNIGGELSYALLHLNDDTNYRLFDSAHPTYVPQPGIKIEINPYTALLFLDGRMPDWRGQETRMKRGVPRVLEVYLDRRSTLPNSEFPQLVQQIFAFARVNWRGFNAQAIPATLNYSYLVARLVSEIGASNWNHIASAVTLRDKAWFL
ncbi:MAG: Piwi domain-containing protein [Calditrichia bacterium]